MLRLRLVSGWMALAILGCGDVALIRMSAQNVSDEPRSPRIANPPPSALLPPESPSEKDYPSLHNLIQVSGRIYSGSEPHGEKAFSSLAKLGVKTIVSVDGAEPNVAAFIQPGLDVELPELVSVAKVDSLVVAMALVDRAFDNLKLCRDAGWKTPPGHPDIVPSQEALLLKEALRETARNQSTDQEERFIRWMRESESLAGSD